MELYIMRHGETVWNAKGIIQGRSHNRLSSNGKLQAGLKADELKDIDFDYIFASPLMRTIQTANIVNKYHNKKIIKDNRIIEIDQGVFASRKKSTLTDEERLILKNRDDVNHIESYDAVQKRVNDFVDYLKSKFTNEKILIVTHRGIAEAIYLYIKENSAIQEGTNLNLFNNADVRKVIL